METKYYSIISHGIIGPFGAGDKTLQEKIATSFSLSQTDPDELPLTSAHIINNRLPNNTPRRTDHFSRLALAAAEIALSSFTETHDMGLIIGTGYGAVSSTCAFKDSFIQTSTLGASPTQFTKSVHNQACSQLAMLFNIHGPVSTVCQHRFPFQTALQLACSWLAEDRVDTVLVGGVDEFPAHLAYCRKRLIDEGCFSDHPLVSPGFPGEGAAFFLVQKNNGNTSCCSFSTPWFTDRKTAESNSRDYEHFTERSSNPQKSDHTLFTKRQNLFGDFPTASALDWAALMLSSPANTPCYAIEYHNNSACILTSITGNHANNLSQSA